MKRRRKKETKDRKKETKAKEELERQKSEQLQKNQKPDVKLQDKNKNISEDNEFEIKEFDQLSKLSSLSSLSSNSLITLMDSLDSNAAQHMAIHTRVVRVEVKKEANPQDKGQQESEIFDVELDDDDGLSTYGCLSQASRVGEFKDWLNTSNSQDKDKVKEKMIEKEKEKLKKQEQEIEKELQKGIFKDQQYEMDQNKKQQDKNTSSKPVVSQIITNIPPTNKKNEVDSKKITNMEIPLKLQQEENINQLEKEQSDQDKRKRQSSLAQTECSDQSDSLSSELRIETPSSKRERQAQTPSSTTNKLSSSSHISPTTTQINDSSRGDKQQVQNVKSPNPLLPSSQQQRRNVSYQGDISDIKQDSIDDSELKVEVPNQFGFHDRTRSMPSKANPPPYGKNLLLKTNDQSPNQLLSSQSPMLAPSPTSVYPSLTTQHQQIIKIKQQIPSPQMGSDNQQDIKKQIIGGQGITSPSSFANEKSIETRVSSQTKLNQNSQDQRRSPSLHQSQTPTEDNEKEVFAQIGQNNDMEIETMDIDDVNMGEVDLDDFDIDEKNQIETKEKPVVQQQQQKGGEKVQTNQAISHHSNLAVATSHVRAYSSQIPQNKYNQQKNLSVSIDDLSPPQMAENNNQNRSSVSPTSDQQARMISSPTPVDHNSHFNSDRFKSPLPTFSSSLKQNPSNSQITTGGQSKRRQGSGGQLKRLEKEQDNQNQYDQGSKSKQQLQSDTQQIQDDDLMQQEKDKEIEQKQKEKEKKSKEYEEKKKERDKRQKEREEREKERLESDKKKEQDKQTQVKKKEDQKVKDKVVTQNLPVRTNDEADIDKQLQFIEQQRIELELKRLKIQEKQLIELKETRDNKETQ
ncbi:MAG: hypothetical protein EZS28_032381, partial [Streblomastix strix]